MLNSCPAINVRLNNNSVFPKELKGRFLPTFLDYCTLNFKRFSYKSWLHHLRSKMGINANKHKQIQAMHNNRRKNLKSSFKKVVIFGTGIFCSFIINSNLYAGCQCSNYSLYNLGQELMAKSMRSSCPSSEQELIEHDKIVYTYQEIGATICSGGTIIESPYNFSWGVYDSSPANIEAAYNSSSFRSYFRLLRNTSGTHFLYIHRNYQGTIGGVYFPQNGPSGVYIAVEGSFNDYCSDNVTFEEPDQDSDSFADCLDCNDENPEIFQSCPVAPADCLNCNLGEPPTCL